MSDALRTLVVDDEKLARDRLAGFLGAIDGVEVIGQAANGVDAVEIIEDTRPDLVFLDVQMPGMSGFEVLQALRGTAPQVIFATAYDEYAIRAFEVQAVDYLLKPFARARVAEAVGRVRSRLGRSRPPLDVDAVVRRLEEHRKAFVTQVPVHSGRRILLLPVDDIRWFGVEHRLVYAHTGERALHDERDAPRARGAPRSRDLLPGAQGQPREPAAREGDRPVVRWPLQAGDARPCRQRGRGQPEPGPGAPRAAAVVAPATAGFA